MKDFRSSIKGIAAVYRPFRWHVVLCVLILDEATSALDSATEVVLLERLASEYRGSKTILMITHRECALTYADEILRLD